MNNTLFCFASSKSNTWYFEQLFFYFEKENMWAERSAHIKRNFIWRDEEKFARHFFPSLIFYSTSVTLCYFQFFYFNFRKIAATQLENFYRQKYNSFFILRKKGKDYSQCLKSLCQNPKSWLKNVWLITLSKKSYGVSIYGSMARGEASQEVLGDERIYWGVGRC